MKELIEQLLRFEGLFIFLAPGIILTISLLLWFEVDSSISPWNLFMTNSFLLVLLLVLTSFVFSAMLQRFFSKIPRKYSNGMFVDKYLSSFFPLKNQIFFRRFFARKPRRYEKDLQNKEIDLVELFYPEEKLAVHRLFIDGSEDNQTTNMINLADTTHKRFLAVYGISLAMFGVGIQALARLALLALDAVGLTELNQALPEVSVTSLVLIFAMTVVVYIQLRRRAIQEWLLESYLTRLASENKGQK